MNTRRLAMNAMLVAMYFVFSLFSIDFGGMKITLESLPVIVSAFLFGPVDGLLVGLLGSFMNQMLKHGFTATTVLWIIPSGVRGLTVGLYALRNSRPLKTTQVLFITVLSALIVTSLNTAVWYIDSLIYHYYSFAAVFGTAFIRYAVGILTAVVFSLLLPQLLSVINMKILSHHKE